MTFQQIIFENRQGLSEGLLVTIQLCLVVWMMGIFLGGGLGLLAARWPRTVGSILGGFSMLLSSIPVLVLIIWMYFPMQTLMGIQLSPFWTAALALSLLNITAVMELVRHAASRLPREYLLTAKIYGIGPIRSFLRIGLPLLLRQILPSLLAAQVVALQGTLFASVISVEEVFRVAQRINSNIYQPVPVYTALAACFILVCLPLNLLALWLGRRLGRDYSEA